MMDYKSAGVDIAAGEALVNKIKPLAISTHRKGVMGGLGGFGALFDVKALGMIDPILVSTTDGVGTKLKLAIETGIHNTIGIDLVAMCVNDLIVQGAQPLYFLDYFATGNLSVEHATEVISGITQGCFYAGCSLVGGETAEMPGMYKNDDYDLAGFAVGAVERSALLPKDVCSGDIILGLASSGIHSNGFSLVRKIITDNDWSLYDEVPWASHHKTLAQELMKPTRIYVKSVLALHRAGLLKAAAHVTGGGLVANLSRVIPDGLKISFHPIPYTPVFEWLMKEGNISKDEMQKVFNCGIGMALIVSDKHKAKKILESHFEHVYQIGKII